MHYHLIYKLDCHVRIIHLVMIRILKDYHDIFEIRESFSRTEMKRDHKNVLRCYMNIYFNVISINFQ